MKYRSTTTWQGEPQWELVITMGEFDDVETAAKFGSEDIKKLKYDKSQLKLFLLTKDGNRHEVFPSQLVVSKLKPKAEGKLMVDTNDFEPVDVKIFDFSHINGLDRGFGSLAYGVVDEDGNPVDCSKYYQQMLKKHEEKMRGVEPAQSRLS